MFLSERRAHQARLKTPDWSALGISEDSSRQNRNAFDLNQRIGSNQPTDYDPCGRWPRRPVKHFAPNLGCLLIIFKRQHIIRCFDNVRQAPAGQSQRGRELSENMPRLRDDVALADNQTFVIGGGGARHKDQVPNTYPGRKRKRLWPVRIWNEGLVVHRDIFPSSPTCRSRESLNFARMRFRKRIDKLNFTGRLVPPAF